MPNVEAAQALLALDPLPEDIEARIDALFQQASEDEKPFFDDLYEALFAATN